MVARDAEGAREAGRPQADQRAVDVAETEFALGLGGIDEARAGLRRIHRASADPPEVPVQADRVEDVARIPALVAATLEVFETRDRFRFDVRLGREARYHGEGRAGVGADFRHMAGTLHLVNSSVEYHHLAVEIGEGAEAKIAMLQDRLGTDLSVINARDEGTGDRDLEQCMNWHAEVLGQGGRDDRGRCSFGPCDLSVQRSLKRRRNGSFEIRHPVSPTGLNSRSRMRQHVLAATRRFRHSSCDVADFRSA